MAGSSQKFIARNRAPRVQIEYDVELYGAEKKVQLPFVMGVMSDLSGKSEAPQPSIADRKFLEIDVDNFDDRMKSMKPRAAFTVPNTLTGEGNLAVDVTFESMDDFSPAAIARKVEPLRKLLEARTQLSNLMTYMDGKTGAEALLERVLGDRTVLAALAGQAQGSDADAALDTLRRSVADMPVAAAEPATDAARAAFDALKAAARPEIAAGESEDAPSVLKALRDAPRDLPGSDEGDATSILAGLRAAAPPTEEADPLEGVLAGLRVDAPASEPETDAAALVLSTLRAGMPEDSPPPPDALGEALAGLREVATAEVVLKAEGADVLAALRGMGEALTPAPVQDSVATTLAALRADLPDDAPQVVDDLADILSGRAQAAPVDAGQEADATDALATLRELGGALENNIPPAAPDLLDDLLASFDAPPAAAAKPALEADPLDGLLASFDNAPDVPAATSGPISAADPLDDLLASFDDALAPPTASVAPAATADPLDDLLAAFDAPPEVTETAAAEADPLDDLLASFDATPEFRAATSIPVSVVDPLDDLLASFNDPPEKSADPVEPATASDPLDDLLTSFDAPPTAIQATAEPAVATDPLDDLLASFDNPPEQQSDPVESVAASDPLDDLLAALDAGPEAPPAVVSDPLADLMSEMDAAPPVASSATQDPFGRLSVPAPTAAQLRRPVFRMAVLGDFTGRAARGVVETGPSLAKRRGIKLDIDTLERVIDGMATTLVLPIGADGAGIEVKLNSLDDLHPDELYENVALFAELAALRQRLSGSQAEAAMRDMAAWGGQFETRAQAGYRQSSGSAVPADRKLGDFQRLIGDHDGVLHRPSPASDLIARIVGPHVVAAPSSDVAASKALVDAALSDAMRLVLHHPEFQQIETQWRTLELLARRIEADAMLQMVLYDISAEELATDLAAGEDLAESGLFGLLADEPLSEGGAGGFSAIIGLYSFEETPPHAELLARIARIAAHVEAPFVTAIAPGFLDTPKADRHPLVAAAWENLRAMPEARYLGLASPRVMLRRPYGRKSEPIERFAFEEFTLSEGLSGMLWANPAAIVAVLLGAGRSKDGARMQLGEIMTLGDIPFHTFTDAHGDQVALPCTERNLTLTKMEEVVTRGFMPVVSIRGRDQVRLASFQSLGGGELRGPWSAAEARPERSAAPVAQLVMDIPAAPVDSATAADDLDALLAGFGNEAAPQDPGAIDADLAALLEGL